VAEYKVRPNVEILGVMLQSLWLAFPPSYHKLVQDILKEEGINEIIPDQWYSLEKVLRAMAKFQQSFGHFLLRQVGEQAAQLAPIPPEVKDLKSCLMFLNQILAQFHRGGNPGGYLISQERNTETYSQFEVVASTSFPCSLTGGYLAGLGKRFAPTEKAEILVRHDDEKGCRRNGMETCTYVVTIIN
jgi:hypothetical protein